MRTYVVFPANVRQGNWRALGDDQADGIVNNLHNGVGLGSEFGGEDLGAVYISLGSHEAVL